MDIWLTTAGVATAAVCALHVFLGGPEAARPLLRARDLNRVARYTNYYCWHMVTIVLAGMAAAFFAAALSPPAVELAWAATLLAAAFALWSIGLVIWKKQKPFHLPQWILFLAVAALGGAGLAG